MAALGWIVQPRPEGRARPRTSGPGRPPRRRRTGPPTSGRSGTGITSACVRNDNREAYEAARNSAGRARRPGRPWVYLTRWAAARPARAALPRRRRRRTEDDARRPCRPTSWITSWPATARLSSSGRTGPRPISATSLTELKRAKRPTTATGSTASRRRRPTVAQVAAASPWPRRARRHRRPHRLCRQARPAARPASAAATSGAVLLPGPASTLSPGDEASAPTPRPTPTSSGCSTTTWPPRRQLETAAAGPARPAVRERLPGRLHASTASGSASTAQTSGSTSRCPTTITTPARSPLLRTAFELYKRDDLLSDLSAHFRDAGRRRAEPADARLPRLALGYLHWWDDDKEPPSPSSPGRPTGGRPTSDLRLELAELREQHSEPAEALALVDAVKPLDHTDDAAARGAALRLAVLTGNVERARQAAERSSACGSTPTPRSGSPPRCTSSACTSWPKPSWAAPAARPAATAALVSLMLQYQRQDKTDLAVQVALQILRSTSGSAPQPNVYNPDDPDAARKRPSRSSRARAGSSPMIERARGAARRTPTPSSSTRRSPTITRPTASATRPAPSSRSRRAAPRRRRSPLPDRHPARPRRPGRRGPPPLQGRPEERPRPLRPDFYAVEKRSAGEQDGRDGRLVDAIDIRSIGQSYYVTNLIQNLMNNADADKVDAPVPQGMGGLPPASGWN